MIHYKDTIENANKAKEFYKAGLIGVEIGERMGKSIATINRYFKITGGISKEDKAYHMMRRYLKK